MLKTLKLSKALAAFCVALGTATAASTLFAAESRTVESPGKVVKVDVTVDDYASYKLAFDGAKVVGESRLGIGFGASQLVGESSRNVDETWTCAVGKRSVYVDRCVETTFELQEVAEPKRKWNIVLRAYDDGVALRYVVPKQNGLDELTLDVDETEFAFGANLDCWATYYPKYNTSQEEFFLRKKLS
ncbi:MAG: glycoside hydrolase family 97 N-terminal domain-containing protein, partial [Thermoguttaceae bacterium]|nr:glycoside hydrolase family 97 N-terminal domain-containing protein [Thermoguttaceae bacterium]